MRTISTRAFQFIPAVWLLACLLPGTAAAAAPANDHFANRIAITGLPLHLTGDTTEATVEPDEPVIIDPSYARHLERSVWWSWTAQTSGMVGINFATDLYRTLRIYTGDTLSELSRVPLTLSPVRTGITRTISFPTDWTFHAEAGTAYHIAVYDAEVFTLDLIERPANDFFADRQWVSGSGDVFTGTTWNATYEFSEPVVTNKSVWYGWTSESTGPAAATLFGGSATTRLEVFEGNSLDALSKLGDSGPGATLFVQFTVQAGHPYSIRVSGQSSPQPFRLSIGRAAVNDHFADATPLAGFSPTINGTTTGATTEAGEPPMHQATENTGTAWWKWIAPDSGFLRITPGDRVRAGKLTLFRGTNLATLARVKISGPPAGDYAPARFTVLKGRTYYLRAQDIPIFSLELELFPRPENDEFQHRTLLDGLSGSVHGHNFLAGRQRGEGRHGGSRVGRSVWWTWESPVTGYFFVTTAGSDFNNVIAAYTGESLNRLVPVADNQFTYWTGVLGFPVTAGTTYQIAVDGVMEGDSEHAPVATAGKIELHYDFTALSFATPVNGEVFVGPTNVFFSLANPMELVDGKIASAVYYVPTTAFNVQPVATVSQPPFSWTASNLEPNVYVFGASVTNDVGAARVVPPLVFAVRPPNDNFSESIRLPDEPGHVRGWVGGASWEPWEKRPPRSFPNVGSSWWVWTAPETADYRVQMITLTSLIIYRGQAPTSLRTVARCDYGYNSFRAIAGETYHFQAFSPARRPTDGVATAIEFSVTR